MIRLLIDMGMERRIWWTNHSTNSLSVDWSRERFTMDDGCKDAVSDHFIKPIIGLHYRGEYIVNWCPVNKTAISDIEVEYKTVNGRLWHIRYPFTDDDSQYLVVATTVLKPCLGIGSCRSSQ